MILISDHGVVKISRGLYTVKFAAYEAPTLWSCGLWSGPFGEDLGGGLKSLLRKVRGSWGVQIWPRWEP